MKCISSDTNVWIDFKTIGKIEIPFRLPCTYIMSKYAIEDELLSPPDLRESLLKNGLTPVEITIDEFFLAEEYGQKYKRLSRYDRFALSIAKSRCIVLLSGDKALRNAAMQEGVEVIGTLGIIDQLFEESLINKEEYKSCLIMFMEANGGIIRLPENEIVKRLNSIIGIGREDT